MTKAGDSIIRGANEALAYMRATVDLKMPNFLRRLPDGSLNLEGKPVQTASMDEVIDRINKRKLAKVTERANNYDVEVVIPTTVSTVGKRKRKVKPTVDVETPTPAPTEPATAPDVENPKFVNRVQGDGWPLKPAKPKRKRRTKKEMAAAREIEEHWRCAEASEAPTPTVKAAKPKKGKRGKGGAKISDKAMMRLITENFDMAGGKWSKMMSILRGLEISASQGRVRVLYMKVEAKRREE